MVSPVPAFFINIVCILLLMILGCHNVIMYNHSTFVLGYLLPLTLILDRDGTVLFCHYGASLTDVPEDCEAIQSLLEEMELTPGLEPEEDELPYEELQTAVAAESRPRSRHGRERPETTDEFRPIRPVHAYPESDLEKTSMFGLFDDPYDDK